MVVLCGGDVWWCVLVECGSGGTVWWSVIVLVCNGGL